MQLCDLSVWPILVKCLSFKDLLALGRCSKEMMKYYSSKDVIQHFCTSHDYKPEFLDSPNLKALAHWRFNYWEGGNPKKVLDHTGNNAKMYLKNIEYADDGIGLVFTGAFSSHYFRCHGEQDLNASSKFNIKKTFTVEAIVKPTNLETKYSEYYYPIVSKHGHACGWELRFSSTPSFLVTVGHEHVEIKAPRRLDLQDKWYHVAGVCTGENIYLYVDHELIIERRLYPRSFSSYSGPVTLGCNYEWGDRRYFEGLLREVRICRKALKTDEMLN